MTTTTTPTDLPRKRFARAYPKMAATAEQRGATEHRRRLLEACRVGWLRSAPGTA